MASYFERFCFITETYDSFSNLVKKYQLFFYPQDSSIEIYDLKCAKIFLKRRVNPEVSLKDLFIGSDVNIYSRKHKLIDYGDEYTRKYFENIRSNTFGMIKPDGYLNIGKIIDIIYNRGNFTITKLKLCKFSNENAAEFYREHYGKPFYNFLMSYITSDYVVGMELVKKDAIKEWRSLIGPTNVDKAKAEAPNSIRALFGTSEKNTVHGSDCQESVNREINIVFKKIIHRPTMSNCACLLIKPHAIAEGNAGKIIDIVLSEGFEISSMEMFYFDKITAEEFFEAYKGVLPEYHDMIETVTTGPVIAMEVRQDDVVPKLRALVGPHDPDIGKSIRKNTIRALFGKDRVYNAVHCTDLPEDGPLEVDYLFNKLSNYGH